MRIGAEVAENVVDRPGKDLEENKADERFDILIKKNKVEERKDGSRWLDVSGRAVWTPNICFSAVPSVCNVQPGHLAPHGTPKCFL